MPVFDGSDAAARRDSWRKSRASSHFGLGDDPSALDAGPILLGGELGGGGGPSRRGSHVGLDGGRALRRLGLRGGGEGQGESRADEKHFHPICEKLRLN